MTTLGIASVKIAPDGTFPDDSYELKRLIDRAPLRFDDVALISYKDLALGATSGEKVRIWSGGRELTDELGAPIAR